MKEKVKENKYKETKKVLLIILCSIIVSVFVGITVLLIVEKIPNFMFATTINVVYENSDENANNALIEVGKTFQDTWNDIQSKINEKKETNGEDYPAGGIFLARTIAGLTADYVMIYVYGISFGVGLIIGIIISVIYIKKNKKE